ncbi:MAG: LytTR family DNA-binding domain-containing protein [Bacteroidota bacterium]
MSPIRTLIVDDEPLAREGISAYLHQLDFLKEIGQAKNGLEAMQLLQAADPVCELLLLDIQMPGLSGTELVETLAQPPAVVFTTAHPSFAVQGFELNALDYLLKPITFPRFLKAMLKVQRQLRPLNNSIPPTTTRTEKQQESAIFIRVEGRIEKVLHRDIYYIESLQNYCRIITSAGPLLPLISLKELLAQLPAEDFIQTHRSYLVRLSAISAIEGQQVRVNQDLVPVSRSRRVVVEQAWMGKSAD